jgi:glycerophosphoryl diester phosphodiesterase
MNTKLSSGLAALLLSSVLFQGCASAVPDAPAAFSGLDALPPIRTTLSCLPDEAALVAAHRATSESYEEPENSLSSLERLIDHGIAMAEVDIASIADGTPILFHDGVWDDHASSTGPVVTTSAEDFERLRLKLDDGSVGGEAVPTLADALDAARGRIYLELDFKTSADVERSVQMIRDRDMVDQVLLIASSAEEAETFTREYGSEFLLSLGRAPERSSNLPAQAIWTGERWRDGNLRIPPRHYVIGAQWQKNPAQLDRAADALDILVTRQAQRYPTVVGLDGSAAFRACLRKG